MATEVSIRKPNEEAKKKRDEELDRLHKEMEADSGNREKEMAWRREYNRCPECRSDNTQVMNFNETWRDGDVICVDCGCYVRMFDAG